MLKITLYSKPNCHLCDDIKIILDNVKKSINFNLKIINIESDKNLFEKYSLKIPVLFINDKIFAKYKVDEVKLLEKLNSTSVQNV